MDSFSDLGLDVGDVTTVTEDDAFSMDHDGDVTTEYDAVGTVDTDASRMDHDGDGNGAYDYKGS
jgi:hypothetical protein